MTAERIETLCYAVRWRVLLKYLGMLGVSTTRTYAWRIAIVYGALTGCAVLGTWLAVGDGFVALAHSLSAVSTGGFSTFDDSLAGLGPGAVAVITGFSWLGAVSLPLYYLSWQKGPGVVLSRTRSCGR